MLTAFSSAFCLVMPKKITDISVISQQLYLLATYKGFCNNLHMGTYADRIRAALKYSGMTQTQLADAVGIKQQTVQYLCSKGKGSRHNQAIANYLGVNPEWLESGKGEMLESNVREAPAALYFSGKGIPLISWVQAGEFCESTDVYEPGFADEYFPRPSGCSDMTYALRVQGDSMTSPYPGNRSYPEGTIIYIDPAKEVLPGHRGIFRLPDSNEATFKELVADAGEQYLKPLNPQYDKIKVTPAMACCGRVIGSFMPE